jgi:hypothetical protein
VLPFSSPYFFFAPKYVPAIVPADDIIPVAALPHIAAVLLLAVLIMLWADVMPLLASL